MGSQHDPNSTLWQWAWQLSSSTGTSCRAEQHTAQAWQKGEQRAWRQEEQASPSPRRITEPWQERHANSSCKQQSEEGKKKRFSNKQACHIPSATEINDSINPKLISRMFVCYARRHMKEKQICCSDQVWLCLLNHRVSLRPPGKIKKARGWRWWTTARETLSHDNCCTAQIRWGWNCIR